MDMNEYLATVSEDPSFEHHGILGQKWGVRRYQNSDGSLTEAGQKRLSKYKASQEKKTTKYYNRQIWSNRKNLQNEAVSRFLKSKELEYVQNMTYDQMMKEKRAVGRAWLTSAALAGASAAGMAAATGVAIPIAIALPRNQKVRSRTRAKSLME